MDVARAFRWLALMATLLVARGAVAATPAIARGAVAATPASIDDIVGTWTRVWPASDCAVTVEIRADGTMTTLDGTRRIDAKLEVQGGPDDQGFVAVARHETHDNAGAGCPREPGSTRDASPARALEAILPFARGGSMAFCRLANLGGCDDWYERVGPVPRRLAGPSRRDLAGAVERQFYALIPQDRATFELVLASTGEATSFTDVHAPGGSQTLACDHSARFMVVGHGATAWNFMISSCPDAASIERLMSKLIADMPAGYSSMPAETRRHYGLDPLDRQRPDGSRTLYASVEVHGVDAAVLVHWAAHVDARRQRAILVMGVDTETLAGTPPQFAANPLYQDPAAIMQALVQRLASDPDAAR